MGRTQNNGEDVLASGGVKATCSQPNVSKEKYQEAVGDFDAERFLKGGSPEVDDKPKKKETVRTRR